MADFIPTDQEIESLCADYDGELTTTYLVTKLSILSGRPAIKAILRAIFAAGRKIGRAEKIGISVREQIPGNN